MFKINDANFFKTSDDEQIFYVKNFLKVDLTKPTLVFNYGLVCSNLHWKYQAEYFDKKGFQVILHDYRGHFQSTSADIHKITFKQMAIDINDLCKFHGVKKAVMLGHSMGVNVSLQLTKDFPELVSGLVLISGTFMPVEGVMFDTNLMEFITPIMMNLKDKYPEFIKKFWTTTGLNPIVRKIIHDTGFNKKKVSKEYIEVYLNRIGQLGPEVFFQLFSEMTRQNIIVSLDRIQVPSLVIGGHLDNVIPNHLQRTLASIIPKAETYFMKDGSHVPQVDFPEMINERIELFIHQHYISNQA
ncbi:MAG TPA: alpha/beta hydrolase [Bacteriovoracaceae bacterium]|nr:alpha/beta hydrolase [Bacteriovoracaceae bacterium]